MGTVKAKIKTKIKNILKCFIKERPRQYLRQRYNAFFDIGNQWHEISWRLFDIIPLCQWKYSVDGRIFKFYLLMILLIKKKKS